DRGYRELVEVPNGGVQPLRDGAEGGISPDGVSVPAADVWNELLARAPVQRSACDIVPRGEGLAGAGQDEDANGIVHLRFSKDLDELALHALRHAGEPGGLGGRSAPAG